MALAFALAAIQCSQRTDQRDGLEDLEDCVRSFCGCWTTVTLEYRATVVDSSGTPIAGARLTCMGEDSVTARSDATGLLAFTIETEESPGCGFARCGNLLLEDAEGRTVEVTTGATLGDTIVLHHATNRSR